MINEHSIKISNDPLFMVYDGKIYQYTDGLNFIMNEDKYISVDDLNMVNESSTNYQITQLNIIESYIKLIKNNIPNIYNIRMRKIMDELDKI
jgi:hypothetical protein